MTLPAGRPGQVVRIDEAAGIFTIEREFDAARELVFEAWSSCEHLRAWFGPAGWTLPLCEIDFRPGGRWRYGMQGPDGSTSYGLIVYGAIEAPARIEYTDAFSDEHGAVDESMPVTTTVIELHDLGGGRTRLSSVTHYASPDDLRTILALHMEEGITQTFDRLDAHLRDRSA